MGDGVERGTSEPTLTDGTVTLRAWRDDDVAAAVAGHDEVIAHWAGLDRAPTHAERHDLVAQWRRGYREDRRVAAFVIDHDRTPVGSAEVTDVGGGTGRLTWTLFAGHRGQGHATRAVRLLVDWAMTEQGQGGLGLTRMEALVEPGNEPSLRVATRAGMRREGVRRVTPGSGDRAAATEYVVLARLATDPPLSEPQSFRSLLNSFLPRKRAIGQMLIRDQEQRVLLCQLTYKADWDLPGGVVEVGESPHVAVAREVTEELGLDVPTGRLVLTDWLPPWGGWDDALCLVFDGGTHDAALLDQVVHQVREIRSAEFCTLEQAADRCADFTARRIQAALASLADGGTGYTESGRPTG